MVSFSQVPTTHTDNAINIGVQTSSLNDVTITLFCVWPYTTPNWYGHIKSQLHRCLAGYISKFTSFTTLPHDIRGVVDVASKFPGYI